MTGQTVSHYRVLEELGRGGMGVVYRAEDTRLGRQVALKFLNERAEHDGAAVVRFLREARAASASNHASICTVHDVGVHDGRHYIVMELLEGQTLRSRLATAPIAPEQIVDWAIQVADALDVAHAQGIVHRDIKLSNLFVNKRDQVKILDFGLAKLGPERAPAVEVETRPEPASPLDIEVTQPGSTIGTVAFMSPEQAQGQTLDGRTDLFSFGVVLYALTAGRLPFRGGSSQQTLDAILYQAAEPIVQLRPDVPAELVRVIDKALEKDRELRYQTAAEMRADLKRLRRDSSGSVQTQTVVVHQKDTTSPAPTVVVRAPDRGARARRAGGAALAVAGLVAFLAWLVRSDAPIETTPSAGRLTLLVSSHGEVSDPDLSPDGKMIALVAVAGAASELFVSRVAGGDRIQLTDDGTRKTRPDFSPDGEQIVFSRLHPVTLEPELCIVPTLGGDVITVFSGAKDPTWSPDGQRLAFVRAPPGEPRALASAATDGSDLRTHLVGDAVYPFLRNPSWSPDGQHLIVERSVGGVAGELWLVPLAGDPIRRLTDDPAAVFSHEPVFTADGRAVIHSSNRAGATNLWMTPIAGGGSVQLTTGPGPDMSPSVAADGSIAFVNPRSRWSLLVHDLESGQSRQILTHSSFIWAPTFSPDGRMVAFSRAEVDGTWHVWIAALDDGSARQLTSGPRGEIYPRFRPDGLGLIYFSWSRPRQIGQVPLAGGPARALTLDGHDDSYGDLSPDGRWLAFARSDGDVTRIHVAAADGSEARRLTQTPSTLPRWSPDGEWIAYSPDRGYSGGVFLVRADGSDGRRLTERGGWPAWWPDGGTVGFLAIGPDGNQEIRTIEIAGDRSEVVPNLRLLGVNYPFDVSPDGRRLAVSNTVPFSADVWLLAPSAITAAAP